MSRDRFAVAEQQDLAPGPAPAAQEASAAFEGLGAGSLSVPAVLAIQRSAGNSAVNALLRQASLQRCGGDPGTCACEDCREEAEEEEREPALQGVLGYADEHAAPGGAGKGQGEIAMGGPEDEAAEAEAETESPDAEERKQAGETQPVQRIARQAVAGAPGRPRRLLRAATWSASAPHEVNNLADCVVNGTPVGVTWPTLNGAQFWSGAEASAAITRPTLTTTAVAAGGFDSEVDAIPANLASYDETVLAPGPWRLATTKAVVAAMLPPLAAKCGGAGNTRFRAYGNPSDAAMFTANRRHEDHHADDHRDAFNATVVPWDTALTAAKAANRKFHGATAADAEAALWAAMGGTPDQVATAFFDACQAAVIAYHGSAAGGPVGAPTNPGSRSRCTITWAKYTNPS